MQNQNVHSWPWEQGAAAPFPSGQPVLPTTFTSTGVEQNSLFTSYQQMYGSSPGHPAADYNQWTSAQFQQWQQWQQWQEKYQQWQAQYGKKYAESMAAIGQNPNLLVPGYPAAVPPVGVPKPVEAIPVNSNANPPLPSNAQPVPPPPPEEEKPPLPSMKEGSEAAKNEFKENLEELSEAEKTFDVQFKQWESEFEEWKKQNQDHPDKAQYKEYEKKWEAWREQLLQRLEQMRKKRLEKASETNKSGKTIDIKGKPTTGLSGKSTETDYGYRTQPPAIPQGPFSSELPKFDKPPPNSQSGPSLSNFNQHGNLIEDKNISQDIEANRGISFLSSQNFHRSLEPLSHFDGSQEGSSSKFGNFEGSAMGTCCNQKYRNSGQFEGSKFGNFDNFPPRRFEERNSGPPARFSVDNFRNERNFSRGFEEDKGAFGIDNRQGPLPKPKVPSLFDIQVEKPPGLMATNNDRKPKVWEKHEDFEKKTLEAKPWGNNNPWGKSTPSPWLQPWEFEKIGVQKPSEAKLWERDAPQSENSPWLKDNAIKRDLDRAELSGYVGNILAKLGNVSVMPPNLGNKLEEPPDKSNDDLENKNLGEGFSLKVKEEVGKSFLLGNEDQSENNFKNQIEQDRSQDQLESCVAGKGNDYGERMLPRALCHFNDSTQFLPDSRNLDIDDRVPDKFPSRRDGRMHFSRDDRNITRTNDRRNFGNDDRFIEKGPFARGLRDERNLGGKFPREDVDDRIVLQRNLRRGFDRFDRDEREGRVFDRQVGGGGSSVGGGSIERFGRHDQLSEPVWKPQVFDYSQGRPLRLTDLEEGFKISTVVDYSHGENKQTFEYGHGERSKKASLQSFDYEHTTDLPTIIDYGHGVSLNTVKAKGDKVRDKEEKIEVGLKGNSETQSPLKRSRSPKLFRSRSRSPHSRIRRNSVSPPFKNLASRNRDRIGRLTLRTDRHCCEDKVSPSGACSKVLLPQVKRRDGDVSKHSFAPTTVLVEDLICRPGRETRPCKLVFIMRGLPGSGKTYVTKLIKDKEVELGGDPPRILSLDDYFMTEVEKEVVDSETRRKVKAKTLEYEYEAAVEPHYRGSLVKAFKKTVSDGFFSFIIVDSVNEKTKDYEEMWSFAKQKGFQVYIAEMDNDVTVCTGRNIHRRTEKEISDLAKAWEETPVHYLRLDVRSLLQSDAITEVEMEVVSDTELDKSIGKDDVQDEKEEAEEEEEEEEEVEEEEAEARDELKDEKKEVEEEDEPGVSAFVKSRWDQFEKPEQNLDRLDGLKRRREGFHATMEDYLQLPDDFDQEFQESVPGKKRVRWADLEERRQQEKMRAIGFVVGQTDWSRMTDPTFGESALTRTKYI